MKWKAPATEPSPDCRPLHEVHATAKDDQGHAWSNGEYAARGRNGRDYAWACHPLPAPQPEMTRTRVFSRLLHKRTMNMMPPCGGEFRHWPPSYPATGIWSTTPQVFRQRAGPRGRMTARQRRKKFFFSPCSGSSATCPPLPPKDRESCGAGTPAGGVARACEKIFPVPNILRTTCRRGCRRPYAAVRDGPPSRPGLSHLAYWHHRHDAGTRP